MNPRAIRDRRRSLLKAASEDLSFPLRFAPRRGGSKASRAQLAEGLTVLLILDWVRYGYGRDGYGRAERGSLAARLMSRLLGKFLLHVDIPDAQGRKLANEMCRRPHIARFIARRIFETNKWMGSEFLVCKRRKLIIIPVWKAASRTLIAAGRDGGMEKVQWMSIAEMFRQCDPQEYYTATFVRHPIARCISTYRFVKDAVLNLETMNVNIALNLTLSHGGVPNHLDCFADFVRFATAQHPCYMNRHWAPQAWQARLPTGPTAGLHRPRGDARGRLGAAAIAISRSSGSAESECIAVADAGGRERGTADSARVLRRGFRRLRVRPGKVRIRGRATRPSERALQGRPRRFAAIGNPRRRCGRTLASAGPKSTMPARDMRPTAKA